MSIPTTLVDFVVTTIRDSFGTSKARRKRDSTVWKLTQWRAAAKQVWLYHDANINQIIVLCTQHSTIPEKSIAIDKRGHPSHQIRIGTIVDINKTPLLASRLAAIISSCPPSLLAELRQWQKAVHIIACIDSAISYISTSVELDPQTEQICDTMFTTVAAFFPPQSALPLLEPAQSRSDDCDCVMDRHVFYDEPPMQTLIASLDEPSRLFLQGAADKERERLPLFPAHFQAFWDEQSGSFQQDKGNNMGASDHTHEAVP